MTQPMPQPMPQSRCLTIDAPGGADRLKLVRVDVGRPGPGEIRIRHAAMGLNFLDIKHRNGAAPQGYPARLGMEAAGIVEAVGEGVTHLRPGDRAAYACHPPGAHADVRVMPAAQVCPLPDAIAFQDAAALMLKGLTVQYLFCRTVPLAPGDTVLLHAAAGGVGLLACQWARAEGLTLIGTAGSAEKCARAAAAGAAFVVNTSTEDIAARVHQITGGRGVDVVMDSVGRDTFEASLASLAPFGTLILFGTSSGPVPPFDLTRLAPRALKLAYGALFAHLARPETCQSMARELFDMVIAGKVRAQIGQSFALEDAAAAHRALESRATTGASVLLP